jgi:predicted alpha-1,2-mannosidase
MITKLCLLALLLAYCLFPSHLFAQKSPADYVDPLIGSAPSTTPSARKHSEAGTESKGQIVPAVGVPQGLTTWTPQTRATEQKCLAPFYYNDPKIQGFRGTHWMNGSCVQDYGSLTVMPLAHGLVIDPEKRASPFSRASETVKPHYYRVTLDAGQIQAEIAATCRAGLLRFTFAKDTGNWVLLEPNSDEGEGFVRVDPDRREVVGYNPVHRIYQGWGKPAGFSGYFVVQFDAAPAGHGVWLGALAKPQVREAKGQRQAVGAYVRFNQRVVHLRIGTSFTSLEQARKNLAAEIDHWNLEQVAAQAKATWDQTLGRVQVAGNESDKTLFYTALYHAKLTPRIFSDADGTYTGFAEDDKIYQAQGFTYYEDYNLWDTYRAVHPLHNLLEPGVSADMVQSLVKKAEQGEWLPIFPCWNNYTAAMIGDHAISVIADAYLKGVRRFDVQTAYRYMRKNAFTVNPDPKSYEEGRGRRALTSYLRYGYVPLEDSVWEAFHKREQVSRTLEYAYDDFALAQVARALGHQADYAQLRQRAQNYRRVIDPRTGYARGRYADGRWIEKFDPLAIRSSFITEGSAAQYTFYVPHDLPGLIKQVGGRQKFVQKLDTLFNFGHYWHGNEPNNQIAYLYPYAGQAWKTQAQVRKIIREEYDTSPGGLSGNEDGGQMSAWLVFSMMGFYPVCPATPEYVLGSPVFSQVTLRLANGKTFTIKAKGNSEATPYIQSATLNGRPFRSSLLQHEQMLAGGVLELQMGSEPGK